MGSFGERDIHKKALELPIPVFDRSDERHRTIAVLGRTARRDATRYVGETVLPNPLGRSRTNVRGALTEVLDEIDRVVMTLL